MCLLYARKWWQIYHYDVTGFFLVKLSLFLWLSQKYFVPLQGVKDYINIYKTNSKKLRLWQKAQEQREEVVPVTQEG